MDLTSTAVQIRESSQVAEARRVARKCGLGLGFDEESAGRVALVATELGTNLVKHGHGGELVVRPVRQSSSPPIDEIELLAIDVGPGMADWRTCAVDGYTTTSSPGTGLGAVARGARFFDVFSAPGRGTVVAVRIGRHTAHHEQPAPGLQIGAVCVPYPGEAECGDAWTFQGHNGVTRVLVADGLGHGRDAAAASHAAVELFGDLTTYGPAATMERLHGGLRHTRGAAAATLEIDEPQKEVRYCGVGNISAVIVSALGGRHLVSHNGTVGHEARRIQEMTYPWPDGGLLLVHSDGIATHWKLDAYPGLVTRHPALVAGVLYRDHRRQRDDATMIAIGAGRSGNSQIGSV
jgi:anti-sigma regulatory factor (Ser/Thr protein kinase)